MESLADNKRASPKRFDTPISILEDKDRCFVDLYSQIFAILSHSVIDIGFLAGRDAAVKLGEGSTIQHLEKHLYSSWTICEISSLDTLA